MRTSKAFLLAAFAVVMISTGPAAAETKVQGADGREVVIGDVSRVVSIGGSTTEMLYALGLDRHIVAVDTTSVYPPEALKSKPNVGYMRALSAEGVLDLKPSVILAEEGAGPPDAVNVIRNASVPMVTLPNDPSPQGIVRKLRLIAKVMNATERGEKLASKIEVEFEQLARSVSAIKKKARVLFVFTLRGGRPMVAGRDTAVEGILALAGAENAITAFSGYKPVSDESIIAAAPDVILMMSRGEHKVSADEVFAYPALRTTPAGENKRLITMRGQYLLGFGPRAAHAARDLAAALYPEAGIPELKAPTVSN